MNGREGGREGGVDVRVKFKEVNHTTKSYIKTPNLVNIALTKSFASLHQNKCASQFSSFKDVGRKWIA